MTSALKEKLHAAQTEHISDAAAPKIDLRQTPVKTATKETETKAPQGKGGKKRIAGNSELEEQLAILRDASKSEEKKIGALHKINDMFYTIGDDGRVNYDLKLTQPEVVLVFHTLGETALYMPESSDSFKREIARTLQFACSNELGFSTADVDLLLPIFIKTSKKAYLGFDLRYSSFRAVGMLALQGELQSQHIEDIFSLAESNFSNGENTDEMKRSSFYLLKYFFGSQNYLDEAHYNRALAISDSVDSNSSSGIIADSVSMLGSIFSALTIDSKEKALDISLRYLGYAQEKNDVSMEVYVLNQMTNMAGYCGDSPLISHSLVQEKMEQLAVFVETEITTESRIQAIETIHAFLKIPQLQISIDQERGGVSGSPYLNAGFFENILPVFDSLLGNPPNNEVANAAAAFILHSCFACPELFDSPTYSGIFGLNSQTGKKMAEQSPEMYHYGHANRFTGNLQLEIQDYAMMYDVARRNHGEPILKTIFEDTNVTRFGTWPVEYLEHQYYNRNRLTGKPLFFVAGTKRKRLVHFGRELKAEYLDMLDVRICEPNVDSNLSIFLKNTSERLGIKPNFEDPNGEKFKFFALLGHGTPSAVALRAGAGSQDLRGKIGNERQINGWPNDIDRNDINIMRAIGAYYRQGEGFFGSCSTSGQVWTSKHNIAETFAQESGIKMWGAQVGISSYSNFPEFGMGPDGNVHLTYAYKPDSAVPWSSYDYRNPARLRMQSLSAEKTDNESRLGCTVQLVWQAKNKPETEEYEVQRSTDGVNFDVVGFVGKEPLGNGGYSFLDDAAPTSEKLFYRIKQRNAQILDEIGSKEYTFTISKAIEPGSSLPPEEEGQLRLQLSQNFPNPFSGSTRIKYSIPEDCNVKVKVYDIAGREVATLEDNANKAAGEYELAFNAANLASGTYIYELTAGKSKIAKLMQHSK